MSRRGRRGYPTSILIGLDEKAAHFWTIYSESVKPSKVITRIGNDEKSTYKFHEEIVESIRAMLLEGFTGVIITSEDRTQHTPRLMEHITKHHKWLKDRATIRQLAGRASTANEVTQLIRANKIQETVQEASEETGEKLLNLLEKALRENNVLYTIEELSAALNAERKPIVVLITEEFDVRNRRNRRFQSLMQISRNLGASMTILKPTNAASVRLSQLGGFTCVISPKP
jgi:stalled ribosome rescue protein Dom34